jgi:outer membrane receptor protein involved in Fe transport
MNISRQRHRLVHAALLFLPALGASARPAHAHEPPVVAPPETPVVGAPESLELTTLAPQNSAERRIDAAVLDTTPRSSADDLLRLVPGLLITRHGAEGKGRQIFLRGFDAVHGADLEVTVDGVPWNEASNVHGQGYLDLGTLIPESLVAMDAHKGSFRLAQGPFATAGSLRFELGVAPERRGTRLDYQIGSHDRHRLVASLSRHDGGSFLVAEALRDDGYGRNRGTERVALVGRATLVATRAHQLALFGGAHAARFGEPGTVPLAWQQAGKVDFYDSLTAPARSTSARAFAALRWSGLDDGGGVSSVLLYAQLRRLRLDENFTGFLIDAQRGDRLEQHHLAGGGGLRLTHEQPLGPHLQLQGGLDALGEQLQQHEDRLDGAGSPFTRNRTLGGRQATLGLRAGAAWSPVDWARLEGGLRAQLFAFDVADEARPGGERGRRATTAFLPRLSATFQAQPTLSFLLAYGRGVRPPEARAALEPPVPTGAGDRSAYRGGPIRPTISDDFEAGLRFLPDDRLELGLGAFAIFIAREQVFDHLSGTNLTLNGTRRPGLEADATFRPLDWLTLRADLTATRARFVASEQPVPGAPTLFGSLEAHARHGSGLSGGGRFFAVGPRPLAHGARAGALSMLDVLLQYRRAFWELSLSVDNLLGTRLREGEFNHASWFDRAESRSAVPRVHYAAGPPRTLRAGLGARF